MRVNLFAEEECRIWFRTFFDGDDVGVERIDADLELGELPEWLGNFDSDWDDMFDPGSSLLDIDKPWHMTLRGEWLLWAGLAPSQPFQIQLLPPRWYRCGEYGEEWDCEYNYEVFAQANWTTRQKIRAWERFLRDAPLAHAEDKARRDKRAAYHRGASPRHMVIERTVFGGYYDDYIPDKQRFLLASRRGMAKKDPFWRNYSLCYSDDVGIYDDEAAYQTLFARAQKEGIKITLEELRKLPMRTRP